MSTSEFGSIKNFSKELKKINKPITTEVPVSRIRSHIKDTNNTDYTRRLPKRAINSDKRWDAFKKWAKGYFETGYSADNEIFNDIQDAMSVLEERYP
jgi:Sec7-like guanine-nucleotide exchange factor